MAPSSMRPARTSCPQPPAGKFYFHGKPQWVTSHKLKIIFKGLCGLFSFFQVSPSSLRLPLPDKNPGGVSNLLDVMQKAKEYSSWFWSYLMISLKINSMLKYIFSVKTKPGLATHPYNLDAIRAAVYFIRVTSFYTKMPRQSKETIAWVQTAPGIALEAVHPRWPERCTPGRHSASWLCSQPLAPAGPGPGRPPRSRASVPFQQWQ